MLIKLFKISSASEKSVYSPAGERAFIPEPLRGTNGDWALVTTREFNSRTDESGNIVPCEPWTRDQVTFIGDFKTAVQNKNAERIAAGAEEALIAQYSQEMLAGLTVSADLAAQA